MLAVAGKAVLAQTVFEVQSALQTLRFAVAARLGYGLQSFPPQAVDATETNTSFSWKHRSVFTM